jgi:hypothetical protein
VNFSGGEPFLPERGRYLGQLVRYCKEMLQLPSVTVVSNGSLIRENWFQQYGRLTACNSYSQPCTNARLPWYLRVTFFSQHFILQDIPNILFPYLIRLLLFGDSFEIYRKSVQALVLVIIDIMYSHKRQEYLYYLSDYKLLMKDSASRN